MKFPDIPESFRTGLSVLWGLMNGALIILIASAAITLAMAGPILVVRWLTRFICS